MLIPCLCRNFQQAMLILLHLVKQLGWNWQRSEASKFFDERCLGWRKRLLCAVTFRHLA